MQRSPAHRKRRKCREGPSDVHFLPLGTSHLPDPPLGFRGMQSKVPGDKAGARLSAPPTAGTSGLLVVFGKGEGLGRRGLPSD